MNGKGYYVKNGEGKKDYWSFQIKVMNILWGQGEHEWPLVLHATHHRIVETIVCYHRIAGGVCACNYHQMMIT